MPDPQIIVPIDILDHNFARVFPVSTEIAKVLQYKTQVFNQRTKQMKFGTESVIDENGIFLTGLVFHLRQSLPHITFEIRDQRIFPDVKLNVPELTDPKTGQPLKIRQYQVDYLIRALKERRLIFDSETGSGKTIMIASVTDCLRLPTLLIAPNKTVLVQLQAELGAMIPHVHFATTQDKRWEESDFLIGLAATLHKIPSDFMRKFKVVLVDEAHTSAASRTQETIMNTNAPYRFGFTADSKGRSDNRDMIVWGLLGEPVRLVDRKELEELGYSPTVVVDFHRGWFEGEHHYLEDLLIVQNRKRNEFICNIVGMHNNCTVLVLVSRIEHGKILEGMLPGSLFVWGEAKGEEREQIRQDMKSGKLKVLIASRVFAMGLDIPNIEIGINAAGGKAEILTGQRIGRIMRTWNDIVKKWIDIYDDYHPKLAAHSKERLLVYKRKQTKINYIGFTEGKKERLDALREDSPDYEPSEDSYE